MPDKNQTNVDSNESQSIANPAELESIPLATTQPDVGLRLGQFSGMWWLTLVSLLVAIGLVWWSLPSRGVKVTVRFPDGHGLQVEDQVQYRGIDVGVVEDVRLSDDHSTIDVNIRLQQSAAALAREGTVFWIVRPQLSITGISGLETAVGHKYISLEPGPEEGARKRVFEGLIDPPPEDSSSPGIEIVVRGDKKSSVNAGSTVTFRGVEVGRVMSVGLSPDSRYVDIRAKVFDRYRDYLTSSSRFWANSGVDVDFSLGKGLSVDTESLSTLAKGGISFLTIDNSGKPIASGHVFRMYQNAEEEWFAAANLVASTNIELGGVTTLVKTWRQKGILGKRSLDLAFNGVPVVDNQGKHSLLIPIDAISIPEKAIENSTSFLMLTQKGGDEVNDAISKAQPLSAVPELGRVDFPKATKLDWLNVATDFRQPEMPEDVFAVRATIKDGKLVYLHYLIEDDYLRADWSLSRFDGDRQLWHGSPVLSADDGKVLGILLIEKRDAAVLKFAPSMFD